MRIAWAVLCRHAEPLPDRSYVLVGAPSDVLLIDRLPSEVSAVAVIKLSFPFERADQRHDVSIAVTGPDLAPVITPLTASIDAVLGPNHEPGWEGRLLYHLGIRFQARVLGPHSVDIRVDGGDPYLVPFVVRQR